MAKSSTVYKTPRGEDAAASLKALLADTFVDELQKHFPVQTPKAGYGKLAHSQGSFRTITTVRHGKVAAKDVEVLKIAIGALTESLNRLRLAGFLSMDPAVKALVGPIAKLVDDTRRQESEDAIEALVKALLPKNDPLGSVMSKIEQDNAAARVLFLETIPMLGNSELAELAGHKASNKSATGTRWKAAQKVFSVPHQGRELYPAFQFADGEPRPVITQILTALPALMSPWQIAFWFVSSNPFLDGAAPYLRMGDPEALVAAARAEADGFAG